MTEALKPTRGPWQIITDRHPHYGGGEHIERRIASTLRDPQAKDFYPVVTMSFGIPEHKGQMARPMVHISEADAHVLAAAFEMLDALKDVVGSCTWKPAGASDGQTRIVTQPSHGSLTKALAAIAKAEGRS